MTIRIHKGLATSNLNLTPLVDVVFLLLIFFLVANRLEQEEEQLDIRLPRAAVAEPTTAPEREIRVSLTAGGDIYVDGVAQSPDSLRGILMTAYAANPGRQRVTIRADEESRTGTLVTVLDACRQARITDYAIATE